MAGGDATQSGQDIGDLLVDRILEFVRLMRANDFRVGVQEELDALEIARLCNPADRQRLRWGLRSLLCTDAGEWRRFDKLFKVYWMPYVRRTSLVRGSSPGGRLPGGGPERSGPESAAVTAVDHARDSSAGGEPADRAGTRSGASRRESLQQADFRFLADPGQMQRVEHLVESLARRMRRRLLRRYRHEHGGRRIDFRRTIRNSLGHGGMPLELSFRQRRRRLPRLVLLLDVSRSMSFYSFLFLRFARGIVGAFEDADAFVFHTRLVRVTEALKARDMAAVSKRLAVLSAGWDGGTRIGDCLREFNDGYARRLLGSRSVVLIFSDGLDTGTPEQFREQLEAIRRRSRKVVWLNPLLGRSGYQPRARCMQAALPYLDLFAAAHSLESLRALESSLAKL